MNSTIETLRIGEVAERTGTTPRTIRYYEEIGLLPTPAGHEKGRHRTYGAADVERLEELLRLRSALGVSLEELKELVEHEDARAGLRREFRGTADPAERRRIVEQARDHVDRQLELVRGRREALDAIERELVSKRQQIARRLEEL
jgi:DNA-binding transcriptional MerR regulator